MTHDQWIALVLFALVGSFSPGPNTTIATVTAANFGLRATLPHVFGVPLGFASMLLLGALGVAAVLLAAPALATVLKLLGIAYLLWLAWHLARAGDRPPERVGGPFTLPLTFTQAALFQYLNPKAWMLAAATAGAWFSGEQSLANGVLASAVFAAAVFASLLLWSALGASLRQWLQHGQRMRRFNLAMGLVLAATALWMLRV
jgi:threonine/homoserine/homoserine lactone efflux protein